MLRAGAADKRAHGRVLLLGRAAAIVRVGHRTGNALLADLRAEATRYPHRPLQSACTETGANVHRNASRFIFLNYGMYVLIEDDSSMQYLRVNWIKTRGIRGAQPTVRG